MSDLISDLRTRPVPDLSAVSRAGPRPRSHPVNAAHPLYQEGWVEAAAAGLKGRNYYHHQPNPPYHMSVTGSIDKLYLRQSVARKLNAINSDLRPHGLELWLFDAWRPIEVQNFFHDEWMPNWLKQIEPQLTGEALWDEVEKYWSRGAPDGVVDPASPPPHNTGGAVDLTIRHIDGEQLWMGTIFDDLSERANTAHYEGKELGRSFSDIEARANRRVLFHLMTAHGFANIWTEWWHYSWGDQRWAVNTRQSAAHYGPMNPCK